ncbi:ubiquitin-specific protease ubp1 [Polyrhizophydium stewartii]|uniref:Ubiquitin carboxyl-terminal hydrolase n=1 Tax=Polyrhizophydium stewartii TaxID=2732419 RepID=A0ABR4N6I0_9FUNG
MAAAAGTPAWAVQLSLAVIAVGLGVWWLARSDPLAADSADATLSAARRRRRLSLRPSLAPSAASDRADLHDQPGPPKRRKHRGEIWVPGGLYNMGNTCFMNSVIQSLVSMPKLVEYIEQRLMAYYDTDALLQGLPVTEALYDLCNALNDAGPSHRALRPRGLVNALAGNNGNRHLLGYQQQDAHELFQFLSSLLTKEEVPHSPPQLFSLADIALLHPRKLDDGRLEEWLPVFIGGRTIQFPRRPAPRSPLTGLLASRICCHKCGYKSPMRHETFDNLSLTVPNAPAYLEKVIENYVQPESIQGYICDKCSILATAEKLRIELQRQEAAVAAVKSGAAPASTLAGAGSNSSGSKAGASSSGSTGPKKAKKKKKASAAAATALSRQAPSTALRSAGASADIGSGDASLHAADASSADSRPAAPPSVRDVQLRLAVARLEQTRADLAFVLQAIQDQNYDVTLPSTVTKVKVASPLSTKQTSIAYPPHCFCLHMQRSVYLPSGHLVKNNARVVFHDVLDMNDLAGIPGRQGAAVAQMLSKASGSRSQSAEGPATLAGGRGGLDHRRSRIPVDGLAESSDDDAPPGLAPVESDHESADVRMVDVHMVDEQLERHPAEPPSPPAVQIPDGPDAGFGDSTALDADDVRGRDDAGVGASDASADVPELQPRPFLYRLRAVIVHYGSHDSGHFVTYRKFRQPPVEGASEGAKPASKPTATTKPSVSIHAPIFSVGGAAASPAASRDTADETWFRISDDRVDIVSDVNGEVFGHGGQYAYMLYYER